MNVKHNIVKLHKHKDNKPLLININEIFAAAQSTSRDYTIIHILDYKNNVVLINVKESVTHIHNLIKDIVPSIMAHTKNKNTEVLVPICQIAYVEPYFEMEEIDPNEPNFYHKTLTVQRKKGKEYSKITFKSSIAPVDVNETVQKIYNKI